MEDLRSDEELVAAAQASDQAALEILLTRYSTIILSFIGGKSFFYKDEPYLDDIRQEVLIKVFKGIKEFTSTGPVRSKSPEATATPETGTSNGAGPGSFKRWVFRIAYFEALNHDKARRKGLKLTSEIFTEETTGIPDDLVFELTPRISDYERADEQLKDALAKLSDEEQKLIQLVAQHTPYRDIIKRPEFSKYKSVDYLMLKVHNIRKRIK